MNTFNKESGKMIEDTDDAKREKDKYSGKPIVQAELNTYKTFKLKMSDFNPRYDRKMDG